jgi:hypothetical protein
VAELQVQLAKVDVQLAAPALTHDVREVLLAQKAALEEELKAAQAKKSANSAAAGACSLLSSFYRAPPTQLSSRLPRTPPSPLNLTQKHSPDASTTLFLQAWRRRLRSA